MTKKKTEKELQEQYEQRRAPYADQEAKRNEDESKVREERQEKTQVEKEEKKKNRAKVDEAKHLEKEWERIGDRVRGQYETFIKYYAEINSLDYNELMKKSESFQEKLLKIFTDAYHENERAYFKYQGYEETPSEELINKRKKIYPGDDEKINRGEITDPEIRKEIKRRWVEISTNSINKATLELNRILSELSEFALKPYSINLQHIFTGRPRSVKVDEKQIQRSLKRITHEIYESGELIIESGDELFPEKLKPFLHKLIDYSIVTMNDSGNVYSLTDGSVFKYFKLGHGGPQRKKLKTAIDWLTRTQLKFNIKLNLTGDGTTISARVPDPEVFLKPIIISYETMGGDAGERLSHYIVPTFLIDLKLNRIYLIYRNYDFFALPDDEYEMLISIHGKLRQSPHYEKGEYAVNLKDFTEKDTSVHKLTRNAKKVINTIHKKFDHLVKVGGIKKYYVTQRGNKTILTKAWYENPKFKLAKRRDGKIYPNYELFEDMIYHFVASSEFVDDHKNIRDKRLQIIEEEKSIQLDL